MATTETQLTPEELLAITDRPTPELVDGQLVERDMGQRADAVASRINRLLGNHVDAQKLGLINGSQCGYQIFRDDANRVRFPDVSFTRKERLPALGPAEGHSKTAPDLAVEVVSPNDQAVDLLAKVREYLDAGVALVWVVNPGDRTVFAYHVDGTGRYYNAAETLDAGPVLPGFQCRVADFFEP